MIDGSSLDIIIYGGNGFVGSHIAQLLVERGQHITCVSRRGAAPAHLKQATWAKHVTWLKGDAGAADAALLRAQDVVITSVGAPPLPTLSHASYAQSIYTNGKVNQLLLESAQAAGLQRAVIIGAKIPAVLQKQWFAYAAGKQITLNAARALSEHSPEHSAVVIQPGGIYGTRHTTTGKAIPLGAVLGPLARFMPSQLISVTDLARCTADAAMGLRATETNFRLIPHAEI